MTGRIVFPSLPLLPPFHFFPALPYFSCWLGDEKQRRGSVSRANGPSFNYRNKVWILCSGTARWTARSHCLRNNNKSKNGNGVYVPLIRSGWGI